MMDFRKCLEHLERVYNQFPISQFCNQVGFMQLKFSITVRAGIAFICLNQVYDDLGCVIAIVVDIQ